MAIKDKSEMGHGIEIDLTGPDGNAFALMGYGKRLAKQLDIEWKPIQDEMMSGNYEHLLEVFDREFGDYVTLYR